MLFRSVTVQEIAESAGGDNFSLLEVNSTVPPKIKSDKVFEAIKVKVPSVSVYEDSDWSRYALIDKWNQISVTTTREGTLANVISEATTLPVSQINEIKVSGPLNESDIKTLRSMSSGLMVIDMSEAEIKNIPEKGFSGMKNLCEIRLPEMLENIGWSSCYNSGLMGDLIIPDGVKEIEGYAFTYTLISSCKFPEELRTIGINAFENTRLRSIDLGKCSFISKINASTFNLAFLVDELILPPNVINISHNSFNKRSEERRVGKEC